MRLYPQDAEAMVQAAAAARENDEIQVMATTALMVDICRRLQAAESRRRFPRVPIRR